MRKFVFTLIVINFIFTVTSSFGQDAGVRIVDSKSRLAIPFAHVCFQEIVSGRSHFELSDSKGEAINPGKGEVVVAISYMGYKTLIDTISAGTFIEFELEPDVFDIDQAVVTASFVPQKADKSIYKIEMIDRREIDAKAASNVADVLSNSINIRLSHDPSLGTGMRLKGLSGNNIKILIDGVPVIGRMGGNIDLSQLNLYNIDHIEMVEGPMSVIYGSNALAGAINIITKENRFTSFSSSLNSYIETKGTYNFDGRVAFKKDNHSLSLSAARNFFNGYSLDSLRSQHWKPKEQYNADLYYIFSKNSLKLKYQTSVMNERLWSKGDLIPPIYYRAIDDWFYSLRYNSRIEAENRFSNGYNFNIVASYSLFSRLRETLSKDLSDLSTVRVGKEFTGFDAFNFRLLFGNQDPGKIFSFMSGIDLNYEIGEGERILDGRQEMGDYAIFGSFMINPYPHLSLQPGFRLAYNSKYNHPPVPSINLKWEIIPELSLRASYARGFRAPTLKELYIYFVDINHNIQPNELLKAEYGNNFDINISLNTDRSEKTHLTKIDANLFYNNMNNIIVLAEISEATTLYQYVNIQDYNTLGGKLTFKYSYYPLFDIEFGIGSTGTYFSLTDERQSLGDYMFSPDASLNISGTIPGIDLKVSAYYKYTGDSWFFRIGEDDQIDVSVMENYHNLDLSVIRKFMSNRLTITAGAKNLFDNTLIKTSGNIGGGVHSSAGGSLIGYGRVFYLKAGFNLFR